VCVCVCVCVVVVLVVVVGGSIHTTPLRLPRCVRTLHCQRPPNKPKTAARMRVRVRVRMRAVEQT